MQRAGRQLSQEILVVALAVVVVLVAVGCSGGEPGAQDKEASAAATVAEFLEANRVRDFERACSLLVVDTAGRITPPTENQIAACVRKYPPKLARALANARVGEAVDVQRRGDVESIVFSIRGAPQTKNDPRYGAPVFITLGPGLADACGRDWCIIAPVPSP